jgi:hypothetical protein
MLGGDVTVASEYGKGSSFTVELPAAGPIAEKQARRRGGSLHRCVAGTVLSERIAVGA